jgi:hypothetical protein
MKDAARFFIKLIFSLPIGSLEIDKNDSGVLMDSNYENP